MADITRYEKEKLENIFKNDKNFNSILKEENIVLSEIQYINLVELLTENRSSISENTIETLASQNPPFLRDELSVLFEKNFITLKLYKQIFYTFKYSTLKNFFQENWRNFLPDYDVLNIENSEQLKIFQVAVMNEFDRFADVIDEIYNVQDIDKIPAQYLDYLAQLIGYERAERELLVDSSFRELVKNIIEIYKIKGTNFSFELFFGFLGFEANISEYWFDKRFLDPGIVVNTYTNSSNKNDFNFYLTPEKPTDAIPDNMFDPYTVTEEVIVETLSGQEFNRFISTGQYNNLQLLGEVPGYPDTHYTFFKTNVVEFKLFRFEETGEISDPGEGGGLGEGISEQEIQILELYARFLTPIFVERRISIVLVPFEDDVGTILDLKDTDRTDPRAKNNITKREHLFHTYSGKQPIFYYWDDGVKYYEDEIDENSIPRRTGNSIQPGGYFISGYFNDTYNLVFNPDEPTSVYSQIADLYPEWDQKKIFLHISELISNKELFDTYSVPSRDIMYPFIDFFYQVYSTQLIESAYEHFEDKKLLIYFYNNDKVIEQVLELFQDYKPEFFGEFHVLTGYTNDFPAGPNAQYVNIYGEDFPSLFEEVETPEDYYSLYNDKYIKQFAGVEENTFHRKDPGKASKFYFIDVQNSIMRMSGYEYHFEVNFLLDYIDIAVPPSEQFALALESGVNIITEDLETLHTEQFGILWLGN